MLRLAAVVLVILVASCSKGGAASERTCDDYANALVNALLPDPSREQSVLASARSSCLSGRITDKEIRCVTAARTADDARICQGLTPIETPRAEDAAPTERRPPGPPEGASTVVLFGTGQKPGSRERDKVKFALEYKWAPWFKSCLWHAGSGAYMVSFAIGADGRADKLELAVENVKLDPTITQCLTEKAAEYAMPPHAGDPMAVEIALLVQ